MSFSRELCNFAYDNEEETFFSDVNTLIPIYIADKYSVYYITGMKCVVFTACCVLRAVATSSFFNEEPKKVGTRS